MGVSDVLLMFGAEAPKRAKIVFTSARNLNAEIYIMNADGSQQIRLTHHPGEDFDPTWSPTGEHIAYHTYSSIPDWAVYFNTLDGREAERIAESGMYPWRFPRLGHLTELRSLSPVVDGRRNGNIRIINLKTREQETLLPEISR